MLILGLSFLLSSEILQATALYVIEISMLHKFVWSLNSDDYERLHTEHNAYFTRLYNYTGESATSTTESDS